MGEGDLSSKQQNDVMQSKKSNSGEIEMNNEKGLQLQASNDTENQIKSYSNYRKNAAISRLKELESKLQVKGSITQESRNTKSNKIKKPKKAAKDSESSNADNTKFFERPNTIRLKIEEDHDKIELIKEFIKNAPKDSVSRIASIGNNIYHIGIKDNKVISKFVMDGFLFKGKRIQPTLFDDTFKIVTIKDLPINIEPKEITRLLSKYGKILCYKMLKYDDDDISWLETGEMKVGLFVHKTVPEKLCIKNMHVKISCRQLVRVCTSCGKECFASFLEDEESEDDVMGEINCIFNSENVNKESKEPVNNGNITGCWTKDGNKSNAHQFNETQMSEVNSRKEDQNGDNCEKGRTKKKENESIDASISKEKSDQIAIQEESIKEYSDDDCSVESNELNSDDDNEGETADNEMALSGEDNEGKSSNDADNEGENSSSGDNEVEICDDDDDNNGFSNDETGREVEAADNCVAENSERDDSGLKSEDADDGDDSGYYLENNNQGGYECNGKDATNKKCDKLKKGIENMEAKMEDHFRNTRAKTFMDTMSTSERRSEFDCERVLVTLMDKIKDNLSSELNRSINRILLAKAMDKYNLWDKWYKLVQERKTVNWDYYYWPVSEEYRRLSFSSTA